MRRGTLLGVIAVIGVYLGFQLVLIRSVSVAQYDESIYLDVARSIGRTGLPIRSVGEGKLLLDQTPLYPYFLGALNLIFNENILWLRLATVAFGAGSVLLAFFIGQKTNSAISGVVAGLLLALNPFFGVYSFFIRMEIFFCFFLLLAIYLLIQKETEGKRNSLIGASLAIMTAVLFKIVAVAFWGAVLLYLFLSADNWRQRVRETLWIGVPTTIGIALWLLFSLLEPGQLEARLERWSSAISGTGTVVDPRMNVALWPWLKTIGGSVLGWETFALFVVALAAYVFARKKRSGIVILLLLYITMTTLLSLAMQLKESRHVIGLIPATAVAIGLMIDWAGLWGWLQQRRVWLGTVIITAFLFAWSLSPLNLPSLTDYQDAKSWWEPQFAGRIFHNDNHLEPLKEIGEYLKTHSAPESMIIVARQGPVVGYYADRSYMFLYTRPFENNMETLQNSEFFVLDRAEFWQQTPEQTEQLLQYVAEQFEIEHTVANTTLYRKRSEE